MTGRTRALVFVCFFLSGVTGLAYQAIWFRHLQSLFGVTSQAVAVVVAAFMGGLAAGSWLFGTIADRSTRPLRLYAVLELGIAASALLVPALLRVVEHVYVALHPSLGAAGPLLVLLRLGLALAALLAPTLLMGGTLPALAVLLRRAHGRSEMEAAPSDLGRLYGINTLGAVAGTALVGFVLLEHAGLFRTTLLAAAGNAVLGIVCWRVGHALRLPPPPPGAAPAAAQPDTAGNTVLVRFAVVAFAISGGLSLAYEVVWTRVLAQIIGSSTYAFSLILTAFLLGIGLGSMAAARWARRDAAGFVGFAAAQLWIGATAAAVVPALVRLPELQWQAFAHVQSLNGVFAVQFGLCLLVVLLPALAMGATFPLVAGFVSRNHADVGRIVGRLYAGNTFGGIVGSLAAGFVLLPRIGTQHTLVVAFVGNALLALAGLMLAARRGLLPQRGAAAWAGRVLAVAAAGVVVWGVAAPRWDPYVLDAGLAIGGPQGARSEPGLRLRDVARGSDILFYREGRNANISVRKDESQFYLKTNGKTDGTTRGDMPTQLMLGLLPALVHPAPRQGLVIGLGTGASARAASRLPEVARLDVVEIEPAVAVAAQEYFGEVNAGLFDDPRVHVVLDDARAFLRTTREQYDFVVSEPSNPWIAGVGNLFSVDHYRRCAARMASGGILAQWLQIYAMEPDLVRMVLASMHTVFPELQVWSFHHGDLIVLASRTPLPVFDAGRIATRLTAGGALPDAARILRVESAAGLLGGFLLSSPQVAQLAQGAQLNTEDRPRLEFQAPRSLYLATRDANTAMLRAAQGTGVQWPLAGALDARAVCDVARGQLAAGRPQDAWATLQTVPAEAADERDFIQAGIRLLAGDAANAAGAATVFERLAASGDARAAREATRLRLMQGRADALDLLARACDPAQLGREDDTDLALQLLEAALERRQTEPAARCLLAIRTAAGPTPRDGARRTAAPAMDATLRARLLALSARAEYAQRNNATAHALAGDALLVNAQCTAAWRVLAALEYEAHRDTEAIRWWERLVEYRQVDSDILVPLARAYQRRGQLDAARRTIRRAFGRDPRNPAVVRLRDELQA